MPGEIKKVWFRISVSFNTNLLQSGEKKQDWICYSLEATQQISPWLSDPTDANVFPLFVA